jgi:gluconate 2-dehydrogenase gamma chain
VWLHALDAPPARAAPVVPNSVPPEYYRGERLVTFTAAEAADLDAFAAQIVPSAPDGLGAREAGSVFFVDRALAAPTREQRPLFARGLAELRAAAGRRGARSFAALSPAAQSEVLTAMEKAKSEFFAAARAAVVVGLLADPKYGGNRGKVGWKLIGFDDRFHWTAPFGHYDAESTRAQ